MWGNQNNGINLHLCEEIKDIPRGYIKVYRLFLKQYHTNGNNEKHRSQCLYKQVNELKVL